MSRYTDVDRNEKDLTPISGYWNYPLVPLEQALAPILPHIEQLDRTIRAAKRYCHYPSEHNLTRDESAAVYLYTLEGDENSFYLKLNDALRLEDRRKIKPWFSYLKLLDVALSKLPTVRESIWRGVSGDVSNNFTKNQVFTWWSVSSCSLSTDVIEKFLPPGKVATLFMIEAINGKNIAGYTAFPNEDEILLGVGTQLRVKSNALKHAGGLHIVNLVEVDDNTDEKLSSAMTEMHVTPQSSKKDAVAAAETEPASTLIESSETAQASPSFATPISTTAAQVTNENSSTGAYTLYKGPERNNDSQLKDTAKIVAGIIIM